MIELRDVRAGYEGEICLQIKEAVFPKGEITSVIGRNGSGKSTLLRVMDGLLPYEGSVCADGAQIRTLSHRERAVRIAYLPQILSPAQMRVQTLVAHGRFSHTSFSHVLGEKDRAAIRSAMERTDTVSLADRNVASLSGGERARAYLAMVIAQESDYLLLDEPASDMDIPHQRMLAEILRTLAGEGKGVILTSHDLPMSFTVSDRIGLMQDGKLLAFGTPAELASRPAVLREALGAELLLREDEELLYRYFVAR